MTRVCTAPDMRRVFGGRLWLAIALIAGQYAVGVWESLWYLQNQAIMLFEYARNFSFFGWLMPLLAAYPAAAMFCADWNSRFAVAQMARVSPGIYARSKCVAAFLGGGVAYALGVLLFFGLTLINGTTQGYAAAFEAFEMYEALAAGRLDLYLLGTLLLEFLAGAFYAMAALAFSGFFPNLYLTLSFPMLVNSLSYSIAGTGRFPTWINLGMLQSGSIGVGFRGTICIALGVFGGLCVLCGLAFRLGCIRRLEHG